MPISGARVLDHRSPTILKPRVQVQAAPYLTADLPGVGGRIRVCDADFRVDEIPLYSPCGHGEHTYARIEKTGIPTFEAVRRVARALGIDPRVVGYAGLKDAHAVTVQTLSLGDVPPAEVERLEVPGVCVLAVDRHTNKLKVGHLSGNRFAIRIRDAACIRDADGIRDTEREHGLPPGIPSETVLPAVQAILDDVRAGFRLSLAGSGTAFGVDYYPIT